MGAISTSVLNKIAGAFLKDKDALDGLPDLGVCAALNPCKPLEFTMAFKVRGSSHVEGSTCRVM